MADCNRAVLGRKEPKGEVVLTEWYDAQCIVLLKKIKKYFL